MHGGRRQNAQRYGSVLTRRCDHFRLRFDGTGVCRLFSVAKIIEYGSDENHD